MHASIQPRFQVNIVQQILVMRQKTLNQFVK